MLRCFESDDITHIEGSVDPIRDAEIIETELLLADLESLERRTENMRRRIKGGDQKDKIIFDFIKRVLDALRDGIPARKVIKSADEELSIRKLGLLTAKPVLYVCNVDEAAAANGNKYSEKVVAHAVKEEAEALVISAAIEAEIAQLESYKDKQDFLETLNLEQTGLSKVIAAGYGLLNLVTFLTTGPKETSVLVCAKRCYCTRGSRCYPQRL